MAILGWNFYCESCKYKEFHESLPEEHKLRKCPKCESRLIWKSKLISLEKE